MVRSSHPSADTKRSISLKDYLSSHKTDMDKSQFIQTKVDNMCTRLINHHSADPSQVELLRAQLDMSNISKYMTHLNTDEGIDRISFMTRSMIGSDDQSIAIINEYLHCFKDIMTQ
jgi:hypothetical protein